MHVSNCVIVVVCVCLAVCVVCGMKWVGFLLFYLWMYVCFSQWFLVFSWLGSFD